MLMVFSTGRSCYLKTGIYIYEAINRILPSVGLALYIVTSPPSSSGDRRPYLILSSRLKVQKLLGNQKNQKNQGILKLWHEPKFLLEQTHLS